MRFLKIFIRIIRIRINFSNVIRIFVYLCSTVIKYLYLQLFYPCRSIYILVADLILENCFAAAKKFLILQKFETKCEIK